MSRRGSKPGERRGGRAKGTPNKRTTDLAERIAQVCGKDFDPVLSMAKLAKEELAFLASKDGAADLLKAIEQKDLKAVDGALKRLAASKGFALEALSEVSQYVHAKRKAVEVKGAGGKALVFEMVLPQ